MIAVIADDFTGAAEMAGIGLRFGLKAELSVAGSVDTHADLLVVSTDSRSMNEEDAEKITADTVTGMLLLKPSLLYKKIDSVLRGHVIDELRVQMQQLGLEKALIVSANPSLGRTISNGNYYIDDRPVHKTGFATDPEFAITDSSVLKMVGAKDNDIMVLKPGDALPSHGIVIGEAASEQDLAAWAEKIDKDWALAGAGDFFIALLKKQYSEQPQPATDLHMPHLYVSGTAFEKSAAFVSEANKKSGCVAYMSKEMMTSGTIDNSWLRHAHEILQKQRRLIIAIDDSAAKPAAANSFSLRNAMAKAVKQVVEKENVKELLIEGGSTSAAILKELGITKLPLVNEISRGVVRTRVEDIYITVKPGSYALPLPIIKLYN